MRGTSLTGPGALLMGLTDLADVRFFKTEQQRMQQIGEEPG
jgi:hypothetical protein